MGFETVDDWTRHTIRQMARIAAEHIAILARDLATLTPGMQSNVDVRIDGLDVDLGPEP